MQYYFNKFFVFINDSILNLHTFNCIYNKMD